MQTVLINNPIGVFDSGLGGLTVVRSLMRILPEEDIVYYGDTARVPYGTKSQEAIVQFSKENTAALLKHKVKLVVVACNSSSSYALEELQKSFSVPVVGVIYPGVRKALRITKNNCIGIIATAATIQSQSYEKALKKQGCNVRVVAQACPLFVPLVEEGWANKKVSEEIAFEYLKGIKRENIDTLILGCTHYPLLKTTLRKVLGKKIQLVDSANSVALEVKDVLIQKKLVSIRKRKAKYTFLITDKPQAFQKIAKRFLGKEIMKDVQYV